MFGERARFLDETTGALLGVARGAPPRELAFIGEGARMERGGQRGGKRRNLVHVDGRSGALDRRARGHIGGSRFGRGGEETDRLRGEVGKPF